MRLFFALWPPPAAREALARVSTACASQFGGQPARAESLHLTLVFLGEVAEGQLPVLLEKARGLRQEAFELNIDRLGCWRHMLWAGCVSPAPALLDLVAALHAEVAAIGIRVDARHFTPHLTLVRKLPALADERQLPAFAPIRWRCSGFVLVQSQPTRAGSAYHCLGKFTLLTG